MIIRLKYNYHQKQENLLFQFFVQTHSQYNTQQQHDSDINIL